MSEALRQAARAALDELNGILLSLCLSDSYKAEIAATAKTLRAALAQPPAPTAPPCNRDRNSYCQCERKAMMCDGVGPAPTAQPVQQPGAEALQGGMDNAELLAAWKKKLPSVESSDAQLTAFAVGVEVGFSHARDLERQDWSRVHHALAKHGAHPGRTDDHLADVIDRALAAPAQRQPLSDEVLRQRYYLSTGQVLRSQDDRLAFQFGRAIEAAHGITAAPEAQKGEKL